MADSAQAPTWGTLSAGDKVRNHRVVGWLASNLFVTRYGLESGRWLLQFVMPPELPPERVQDWLGWVQRLCTVSHPNLLIFVEAFQEGSDLFVVTENPRATSLQEQIRKTPPDARHLLRWASQLAKVGCHLVEQGFPIGAALPRLEHLGVQDSQLVVGDPGLTELLWQGQAAVSSAACIHRFGDLLRELCPRELPANLEWIAARCQAKSGTGYTDFSELAQAFEQALVVEVPETTRTVSRTVLPLLRGFQLPWLAKTRRFPLHRLWLALALMAMVYWAIYTWLTRPLPPRTYPAAVIGRGKKLLLVDLNSGITRRQLDLPGPVLATQLVGKSLLVICRGARRLVVLNSHTLTESQGPAIDPDPALLVADASGRRIYLLYPAKARVLVIKLPNIPIAYLNVLPSSDRLLPVDLETGPAYGLLVSSRFPALLRRYSMPSRLVEREAVLSEIDNLAADQLGGWWVTRENRLERLNYQLEIGPSFELSAPAAQLLAVGSRLVCTQPKALVVLEEDRQLTTIPLQATPRFLRPDPLDSNRIWLLEDETLTSLDLAQGSVVKRWRLSTAPPETLTILP